MGVIDTIKKRLEIKTHYTQFLYKNNMSLTTTMLKIQVIVDLVV